MKQPKEFNKTSFMSYIDVPYIFVGAGLSTLSCITKLTSSGVKKDDLLILEALDYVGGRIKTIEAKYETGASWLHDSLDNQVFDYMLENDMIEVHQMDDVANWESTDKVKAFLDDSSKVLIHNGVNVTNHHLLRLEVLLEEFEKYVENYFFEEENVDKDPSLRTMFFEYIKDRASKKLFTERNQHQLTLLSLLARYVETWHGISWDCLSAKYAFLHSLGQNILCFGLSNFTRSLAKDIKIDFNTPVMNIKKEKGKYIINDKYSTNNCIISSPLSAVKSINFENHLLSENMKASLDKVHYGALGKLFVEFDLDFDFHNTRLYHLGNASVADQDTIKAILASPKDFETSTLKNPAQKVSFENVFDWPMLVVNTQKTLGKPVLQILTQEPVTSFIEKNVKQGDNEFIKCLLENIQKHLYSKENIKKYNVLNVLVSGWTQNEYQRGSYPACYPGDDPIDITIQSSLQNESSKLKFIGEYTNLEGCGSMNGAWLSGIECAEKLMENI